MAELYESKDKMVSHPTHYGLPGLNGVEVIDVIESVTRNMKGIYATDTGNIIKYACRWDKKGHEKQDVEKIIYYATHLLKKIEDEQLAYTE